jgi:uncharacterized delta-60 repeat protein|tara:strand:+ start:263 stop:1519 length:1257 start_codon:yes stop_codon:yes gene_type:complete
MAELRIGTILPTSGDIKVGDTNVLKIYSGEVLVFGGGTFNENLGTGPNGSIHVINIQSDGKILFGGFNNNFFNGNSIERPIRLNTNGTLDSAYMANRSGQVEVSNDWDRGALLTDGSAILGGKQEEYRGFSKLNDDGTANTTFNTNAGLLGDDIYSVEAMDTYGNYIIMGGNFGDGNIRKYDLNGNEDTNFGSGVSGTFGTINRDRITTIKIQSDGKILVCGYFTTFNSVSNSNRIVRINSDGTSDTAFNTNLGAGQNNGTIGTNPEINAVAIQSDDKILVGGAFEYFNYDGNINNKKNRLVRLNPDGSEDNDFYDNLGDGFNNEIWTIEVQSDGKILVGGDFSQLDGNARNSLVRLNEDGSEDTTFYTNLTSGVGGKVLATATQTDDKILVGGFFTTIGGVNLNNFARLNSNGTVEP